MWNAASPWRSLGGAGDEVPHPSRKPHLEVGPPVETRLLQSVKLSRVAGVALDKRGRVAPALEARQRMAAQYILEIAVGPPRLDERDRAKFERFVHPERLERHVAHRGGGKGAVGQDFLVFRLEAQRWLLVGRSCVAQKMRFDAPQRLDGIKPAALAQLAVEGPEVLSSRGGRERLELRFGGVAVARRQNENLPWVERRRPEISDHASEVIVSLVAPFVGFVEEVHEKGILALEFSVVVVRNPLDEAVEQNSVVQHHLVIAIEHVLRDEVPEDFLDPGKFVRFL